MRLTRATASQIAKATATHDAVNRRWFEYETDLATIIERPLMTDMREPLTRAFHEARIAADDLRPDDPDELLDIDRFTEYRDAVRAYSVAFSAAETEARRRKQSAFDPLERQRLERARKLVMIAVDEAATPAERRNAYRRARDELDGLIAVPDVACAALERSVAGELEAGSES
ncbi:hypothetical protein GCM10027169_22180 [Gordonia jinhuaensis]|uniref:Uncharacterized protein n=1 Tax=Gordonia jinhuaensis TaxID=1517702 RepID=A0A916TF10_9ACTN|nr:hypothetical protein GCM10011489_32530 [Gordonia jinhuaensis]